MYTNYHKYHLQHRRMLFCYNNNYYHQLRKHKGTLNFYILCYNHYIYYLHIQILKLNHLYTKSHIFLILQLHRHNYQNTIYYFKKKHEYSLVRLDLYMGWYITYFFHHLHQQHMLPIMLYLNHIIGHKMLLQLQLMLLYYNTGFLFRNNKENLDFYKDLHIA